MKKYLIIIGIVVFSSISFLFAYDQEITDAYTYAHTIGITTMPTIEQANMDGKLIRSHMAKMMSNYATEVLHLVPNTGKICNFNDILGQTDELKLFITKACQLGLMGVDLTNFDPQGEVTRAQFGTVLSRAMYGTAHNYGEPYYVHHLQALKTDGIMNTISQPNTFEIRGFVMLMMKRADVFLHSGTGNIVILPTAIVAYSTTGITNQDVTTTLTGRNKTITGVNTYSHVFTGNGSFIFYFQDLSGNLGSITATVNNIDKVAPTINNGIRKPIYTSGDVLLEISRTLTGYSEALTITNNSGLNTHTFTSSGSFTWEFADLAGNTGSKTITDDFYVGM